MVIKSNDVNPPKEDVVPKKKAAPKKDSKESVDINMKYNDPKEQLEEALEDYENKVRSVTGGKVLMKMERENLSFVTEGGVKFTQESPFQLVYENEVESLLQQNFRKAYVEEVKEFYLNQ